MYECCDRYRDELTRYHMAGLDTRSAGTNTRAERAQVASEATKSLMKKLVKRHVWRTIKFITNHNQLDSCINKIWDHMPRSYHQTLGYEQRFKDHYRNLAGTILNQVRSEVTTAMRLCGAFLYVVETEQRFLRSQTSKNVHSAELQRKKIESCMSGTSTCSCPKFAETGSNGLKKNVPGTALLRTITKEMRRSYGYLSVPKLFLSWHGRITVLCGRISLTIWQNIKAKSVPNPVTRST